MERVLADSLPDPQAAVRRAAAADRAGEGACAEAQAADPGRGKTRTSCTIAAKHTIKLREDQHYMFAVNV